MGKYYFIFNITNHFADSDFCPDSINDGKYLLSLYMQNLG